MNTNWVKASVGGRAGVNATLNFCLVPSGTDKGWDLTGQFCMGIRGRIWANVRVRNSRPWEAIIWQADIGGCTDSRKLMSF